MFDKILITKKSELHEFKGQIATLFTACFNREFDDELWQWAYIDNPNADPIISLFFDKATKELAGHYALIPIFLRFNNQDLKCALSMGVMVGEKYRKFGLVISQAVAVYDMAKKLGYELVYGFPNKNSAPALQRLLGWNIDDSFIAELNSTEIKNLNKPTYQIDYDTLHPQNSWRLDKPKQLYKMQGKNILKNFSDQIDLVYNGYDFDVLDTDMRYNVLTNDKNFIMKKKFDYVFGYRLFNQKLKGVEFKKDLIMSDVF
ncbi:GNAT family N-acetyltransferase [Campylobacter suis]|uniref:GNAT family N-acetyltransferase n=1 Tax=Campylobacter suis TaxID=2790657 RepID=A0ABM8Q7B3_9BACT|nr:GNAT family N-acetyltransferase [Campylobacter suis]CAD7288715.1 hypothetical protein LMG8286_01483 [Campylobacter suis]